MPKIVDRTLQKEAIRSAARQAFARRGVDAVGLVHVARVAGIGRASIYHYYPDKASLVRDLIRDLLTEEESVFFDALRNAKGTPLERIEILAKKLTDMYAQWATLGKMLIDLLATSGAMFRPFFRRIRGDLAQLIADGQHTGEIDPGIEAEEGATGVIALIDGVLLQMIVDRAAFGDAAATRRLLVRSVRKILQP